jgi:hypothetical protein
MTPFDKRQAEQPPPCMNEDGTFNEVPESEVAERMRAIKEARDNGTPYPGMEIVDE